MQPMMLRILRMYIFFKKQIHYNFNHLLWTRYAAGSYWNDDAETLLCRIGRASFTPY